MRASSAAPSASRTGTSSIRSSTSWKNPRTISRSASRTRKTTRHQVEELVAVDAPERRTVRAANVVRHDLEARDRVGVRVRREQQVAVLLVGVRLLRLGLDPDHPAPHRARGLAKRALEREVRLGRRSDVLLEGVVVEVLVAVGEVGTGDARGRAGPVQVVLDPDLPLLRAEAAGDPVELGVALDARVMRGEVPRLAREVLDRDVLRASPPARRRARRPRSSRPSRSGRAEVYSSISVNCEPSSATTSRRQKSEPFGDGVCDPDVERHARGRRPSARGRTDRAAKRAALCAANFSSQPTSE